MGPWPGIPHPKLEPCLPSLTRNSGLHGPLSWSSDRRRSPTPMKDTDWQSALQTLAYLSHPWKCHHDCGSPGPSFPLGAPPTLFGVFSSSGTQGWGEEGRFQRSGVFRAGFEPPAHRNTAWVKVCIREPQIRRLGREASQSHRQ